MEGSYNELHSFADIVDDTTDMQDGTYITGMQEDDDQVEESFEGQDVEETLESFQVLVSWWNYSCMAYMGQLHTWLCKLQASF